MINNKDDKSYLYIEGENECNICYEKKYEFFKCIKCVFISCPKCFNKYYFIDNKSKFPICRN